MFKVKIPEVVRFMVDCLKAAGAPTKAAEQQACLLAHADVIGMLSDGINRLDRYCNDIIAGVCKPDNEPKILKETESTAWVDANNVLGATSSHFGMDLAIDKAKKSGVGWVCVKGANHNGMLGYWSKKAASQGFIGITFANTSPVLAPTRSKTAALGSNPLAVVAPGSDGEMFYLDISTSSVSLGKIEVYKRRGWSIPFGWAQDFEGKPTSDADLASKAACLVPLGGREYTSGYKGYGLSAMVEVFCGMCAGSSYGHHIRKWGIDSKEPANLGNCFIAVDPNCFAPGFGDRLTECIRYWRQLEPIDPKKPVLAPGDLELRIADRSEMDGFITYMDEEMKYSQELADKLKVRPLKVMKHAIFPSAPYNI